MMLSRKFQPTNNYNLTKKDVQTIFKELLPNRLFQGPNHDTEIDLYGGGQSPDELFGGGGGGGGQSETDSNKNKNKDKNKDKFYFFTKLERLNGSDKMMKREIEGKGTWLCKSVRHEQRVEISPGKHVKGGTRRQFNFRYFDDDHNNNSCKKEGKFAWIMQEYVADINYMEYIAKQRNIQYDRRYLNDNIEFVAFCYVYKKVVQELKPTDKRKRNNRWLSKHNNKKICIRDDFTNHDCNEEDLNDDNVDENSDMKNLKRNNNQVCDKENEVTRDNGDEADMIILNDDDNHLRMFSCDGDEALEIKTLTQDCDFSYVDKSFEWFYDLIRFDGVDLSPLMYY